MSIEAMKLAKTWFERNTYGDEAVEEYEALVQAIAEAEQEQTADGWRQDGGLLYRLTDERSPKNRDEINVTMADGSRTLEACTQRAGELLDRIRNTAPPSRPATELRKPLTDEQRNWIVATCPTPRHIIDTVEKMHGIKEKNT